MASTQAVWGIDVGRCALKAIKLRPAADGKVELAGFDYVEHAKILSQADADRNALIGAALEKLLSRNDLSKDYVVVSVPGQHTLARFTKLPPVAPKRIPDIVRYEADQQIPFDMDEVIWDYQTFQQEGMPDLEVGIFAMKRELIREHLLHFEQAAIEPIGVQSGPLAVYNAAHFEELLGDGTSILLDVGAENTDLVIATRDALWTRTVPIGGNRFTEALVKSFKLSFSKAENLKRTAASSKYARQIFQAMRPVFADLVQELQRSIGFYSSTHRDTRVERVIGVGNAFRLPGLQKYLQQNLSLNVDRPQSFRNAPGSAVAGQEAFKEQFLSMFTAYGLALQGLDLTKVTSNLLPTEIAKQVVWRKKRPAFAAAAACVILAGGLIWFRQITDMRALAAGTGSANIGSLSLDQAIQIVRNGPRSDLSDRARAATVLEAGSTLKKTFSDLSGKGGGELEETKELVELLRKKQIAPGIFRVINESLPTPSGVLAQAQTVEEIQKAIASAPPRSERDQVFIESLNMLFEPELGRYPWTSAIEVPAPINTYDVNQPLPGMLIKITCRTPNTGGPSFIRDKFMMPLRRNGRKPGQGFYIDQVVLIEGNKIASTAPGPTPTVSRGGGTRGGAAVAASPTAEGSVDPVTLESAANDWRFEVWASAILAELPDTSDTDAAVGNEEGGDSAETP